jgi:hypothetical protein
LILRATLLGFSVFQQRRQDKGNPSIRSFCVGGDVPRTVHLLRSAVLAALLLAPGTHAAAQDSRGAQRLGTWAIGASAGLWDHLDPSRRPDDVNVAVDASIERRFNWCPDGGGRAIRVQVGRGAGGGRGGPGFDYTRLTVGTIHHIFHGRDYSGVEGAVYVAAGGGAHVLTPATDLPHVLVTDGKSLSEGRRTRPSAFGGIGWDLWLGTRRATVRGEAQLYSIGSRFYGSASLGLQVHFR